MRERGEGEARERPTTSRWRSWWVLVISSANRAEMRVSSTAMKATAMEE